MRRLLAAILIGLVAAPTGAQTYQTGAQGRLAQTYQGDLRGRLVRELAEEDAPQGSFVEPRIESALMMVGNINLAPAGDPEIDLAGFEVAPGIYSSYVGPRGRGFVDYTLIGRLWEDSDYNEINHRLRASGNYLLLPEWMRVGAHASYSDSVIDPTLSFNYGNSGLFAQNNLSEQATASVSPQIFHDFGDVRFDASYSYGRVWYLDAPEPSGDLLFSDYQDDSVDQQARVSLGSSDPNQGVTLSVVYEWQDSDFERTVGYVFERLGAEIGARLTRTIRFVADGGVESDLDASTTAGGLDSGYWHAGFAWQPERRTSIDARYGERFFGDSWSLGVSRDTAYVTIRASYSEDPQVNTRRIGIGFDPGELPLPDPDPDLSGFTSQPYVGKDTTLMLLAEGARTRLRLDAYDRKREYIRGFQPDERTTGVRFNAIRDIGAYLYLEVDTRYEDVLNSRVDLTPGETFLAHYYDFDVMTQLSWQMYTNFITSAEVGYLHRAGSINYDGQWLAFRLRYTF